MSEENKQTKIISIPNKQPNTNNTLNVSSEMSSNNSDSTTINANDETFSASTSNQNRTLLPEISIHDIENGQAQIPWVFTKRCYIFGFVCFPLWFIGLFYVFSKKDSVKFWARLCSVNAVRSEEHTSDSSHRCISYAVFCLKKKHISFI